MPRRRCLGGCGRYITRGSRCPACRSAQKAPYRNSEYQRLRPLVLERDGHQCQIRRPGCEGTATTVDHIDASTKHLTPTMADLRSACLACNSGKRDRA